MNGLIRNKNKRVAALALTCAALFFAGGCVTTPGSSSTAAMKIAESERSIDAARHDCVHNEADVKNAELKLKQAREALDAQDYPGAAWRADEATADANYARTKAAQEQAEQSAEQLQKSNERLKKSLNDAKSY